METELRANIVRVGDHGRSWTLATIEEPSVRRRFRVGIEYAHRSGLMEVGMGGYNLLLNLKDTKVLEIDYYAVLVMMMLVMIIVILMVMDIEMLLTL
ncbi:hypothetical protein EVAR_25395_1 [Eumeta japonica]|uniref:Uncharacterized protein n=1 Tax=Eumeta variegata TaxID=151549 RepID=A0A4C1V6X5_EUMVA|nr:hypothetical protein EVAR_25395_1 [Eumeta japonica]